MTNWKEYQFKIRKKISSLPPTEKLQLAIQNCEKLYPDYLDFQRKNKFGNADLLKKGINLCLRYLNSKDVSKEEITSLITQIEVVTPDTDEFGDLDGSLALNAACSILDALRFVHSSNEEYIFNVANYTYDSTYFRVSDQYPNLNEEEIQNHPSIIEVINWQLDQTAN